MSYGSGMPFGGGTSFGSAGFGAGGSLPVGGFSGGRFLSEIEIKRHSHGCFRLWKCFTNVALFIFCIDMYSK